MTTGRKPLAPAEQRGPDFATATPADLVAADKQGNEVLRGEDLVMDFEEPLRQIGQLEAFEFTRRIGDIAMAQIFENLRTSNKYKGLPYRDAEGCTRHVGSLEELCRVKLGKSYNRCIELSQNLRLLGPELYEQSERLGLRNIDYKALRALPGDDQALVKKAIEETQSRDEVLDLLQEMAARHVGEKEALTQQLQSKDEVLAGKQKLVDYQATEIDALAAKVRFVAVATPSEKLEGIRTELLAHAAGIEGALAGKLRPAFAALKEHLAAHGGECDAYLSSSLGQIERAVREIREDFGLLRAEDVEVWANAE